MAATRLLMRRLRDVLRLKYDAGLPHRAIAQACTVGLGTVTTYLQRVAAAGLSWPLPDDLDDAALEARVFARPGAVSASVRPTEEDTAGLFKRLTFAGVNIATLAEGDITHLHIGFKGTMNAPVPEGPRRENPPRVARTRRRWPVRRRALLRVSRGQGVRRRHSHHWRA